MSYILQQELSLSGLSSDYLKELHFKVLNDVYPSGEILRQSFNFIFCEEELKFPSDFIATLSAVI